MTTQTKRRAGAGLHIPRRFTVTGKDPFASVSYEKRTSTIKNPDGTKVFEITDVEVPADWSQIATDIIAQKYFRKTGVPQRNADGTPKLDADGKPILGPERSARQTIGRMTRCWRFWGEQHGYFATASDAQAFEDELNHMLLHQMTAPNSPQWFNTGLALAYGITGPAQGHWYVDPETKELTQSADAYTRAQVHACFIQSVKDDLLHDGGIFDLVVREARVFKYGSGTGTNFSTLRGAGEPLSGGGKSSGLMSFLKINDRAAGAIKSGGTTRRAAKMVCLDLDHPEIETFIDWKMLEEQKVADLVAGAVSMRQGLTGILRAVQQAGGEADLKTDASLRAAVRKAIALNIPLNTVGRTLQLAAAGETDLRLLDLDTHFEGEAYNTVSGQNSNNSIRIPNRFFSALDEGGEWPLIRRLDRKVHRVIDAKDLWKRITFAAWASADPGVQYDDTINEWHTCPEDGRINASNPCSEYMFLDDTACNLASINLGKFLDETGRFAIEDFRHASRLWTVVLEISVLMAQFPSREIARLSYDFRTLGLGYANLGTILMRTGIPYDSDQARAIAGAITAIMCGESYATSAEMAAALGPFPGFARNREHMLRVMRNHRRAAYDANVEEYEGLTITPVGINPAHCPSKLLDAARDAWDRALALGEQHGYRNAQVTVIAPTGTIGLVMDCDTTGVEPDFALVKFKKLAGGGYLKIVNQSVPTALATLGYGPEDADRIVKYAIGHGTLRGCPHINPSSLRAKGFTDERIAAVEKQLASAFDLSFAFTVYALGAQFLRDIGLTEAQIANPGTNVLEAIGFSRDEIDEATAYVCGTMTIEGAPGLAPEHLPVFDCANRCGKRGKRFIAYEAHIRMMAAVQPFISGAISKTINMPKEASISDIGDAYRLSWSLMVKANALYRDGCKLSQPLNATSSDLDAELLSLQMEEDVDETVTPQSVQTAIARRAMPARREGFTHEVSVGGHKVTVTTGEFEDGSLGELSIDMYKEGGSYRCLVNAFADAVSIGLQHGVPLDAYVGEMTFRKFEPAGPVMGDAQIKQATSPVDYVFRLLASEYLGDTSMVHVKEGDRAVKRPQTRQTILVADEDAAILVARDQGYTGDACGQCGSMKVKQNGTCSLCLDCGTTSGCS